MEKSFQLGEWKVEALRNEIVGPKGTVKLEPRVMQVLVCLATRAGEVVSREQILEHVWEDRFVSDEVLTVAIQKLRSALGDDSKKPRFVQTVPGKGYRLDEVAGNARKPSSNRIVWMAAALAGVVAVWIFVSSRSDPALDFGPSARIAIDPPPESDPETFLISPDGEWLAFIAPDAEGVDTLWVRELDSGATRVLAGTENVWRLFWSPDSRQIAFSTLSQLKKVRLSGGPPETLREAGFWGGGAWSDDDVLIVSDNEGKPYRMRAQGGEPTPLVLDDGLSPDADRMFPFFLPDGDHFLYFAVHGFGQGRIIVGSLETAESVFVAESDSKAVYADGYLLFVREGTLHAQSFDLEALEIRGEPYVLEPLMMSPHVYSGQNVSLSVSKTGVLAFRGSTAPAGQLVWFDREGRELGRIPQPSSGEFVNPSLSPDGGTIAVNRKDSSTGNVDIWLIDVETAVSTRFTTATSPESDPVWSPDGERIVYGAYREGGYGLWLKTTEDRVEELLLKVPQAALRFGVVPREWSDDDVVFYNAPWSDLWAVQVSGERDPWPIFDSEAYEGAPKLSPSGEWLAYTSDETGFFEIYVMRFPEQTKKRRVSAKGGIHPTWREDGKELFYWGGHNRIATLMRVDVAEEANELRVGVPEPMFEPRIVGFLDSRSNYAASPDGQRFLLRRPSLNPPPVTVVVNWTAELERR